MQTLSLFLPFFLILFLCLSAFLSQASVSSQHSHLRHWVGVEGWRGGCRGARGLFGSLAGRQFPGLKGSAVGCLRNWQPSWFQRGCFSGGVGEGGYLVAGWHGADTDSFPNSAVPARPRWALTHYATHRKQPEATGGLALQSPWQIHKKNDRVPYLFRVFPTVMFHNSQYSKQLYVATRVTESLIPGREQTSWISWRLHWRISQNLFWFPLISLCFITPAVLNVMVCFALPRRRLSDRYMSWMWRYSECCTMKSESTFSELGHPNWPPLTQLGFISRNNRVALFQHLTYSCNHERWRATIIQRPTYRASLDITLWLCMDPDRHE